MCENDILKKFEFWILNWRGKMCENDILKKFEIWNLNFELKGENVWEWYFIVWIVWMLKMAKIKLAFKEDVALGGWELDT